MGRGGGGWSYIIYIYIYTICMYIYDFQQYEIMGSFGDNMYTAKINIVEAEIDESNLLKSIVELNYLIIIQ